MERERNQSQCIHSIPIQHNFTSIIHFWLFCERSRDGWCRRGRGWGATHETVRVVAAWFRYLDLLRLHVCVFGGSARSVEWRRADFTRPRGPTQQEARASYRDASGKGNVPPRRPSLPPPHAQLADITVIIVRGAKVARLSTGKHLLPLISPQKKKKKKKIIK